MSKVPLWPGPKCLTCNWMILVLKAAMTEMERETRRTMHAFSEKVVVLTCITLGIAVATLIPNKFQAEMGILLTFMFD